MYVNASPWPCTETPTHPLTSIHTALSESECYEARVEVETALYDGPGDHVANSRGT